MAEVVGWTCGECSESFTASGYGRQYDLNQMRREHQAQHRFEKMSDDEKRQHLNFELKLLKVRSEIERRTFPSRVAREVADA